MAIIDVKIPEYRDPLEKVVRGLQIAQSITGIKSNWEESKIRKLQLEKLQEQKLAEDRAQKGEFTEGEYLNAYQVPEGTPGSSKGYVDLLKRTDEGKILYDSKTGQPITERKIFYHVPRNSAEIQSFINKQALAEMALNTEKQRAAGYLVPDDVSKYVVVDKKTPNAFEKKYINSQGKEETVYVLPKGSFDAIAVEAKRGLKEDKTEKYPEWVKGDYAAGYEAAKLMGIKNPTPEQAREHSPAVMEAKVKEYANDLQKDKVPDLYNALKNFDEKIGIDYAVITNNRGETVTAPRDAAIPGLSGKEGWVPKFATNIPGLLSSREKENRSAVQGIVNLLLSERSGAAINREEAGRLAEELNNAYGQNDPVLIRNGVSKVRAALRTGLQNFEMKLSPSAKAFIQKQPGAIYSDNDLFLGKKITDKEHALRFLRGQ